VRLSLGAIDLITLDIAGTVTERLDAPQGDASENLGDEDHEADSVAGPIAIALDVKDAEPVDNAGDVATT
jgi:exoribonuclease-2